MSLYAIQDTTLIGIGDAIRTKGGTSDAIPVTGLADAITNLPSGGGGGIEVPETINVRYPTSHFFAGDKFKWLLDAMPNQKFSFDDGGSGDTQNMITNCYGDYSRCSLRTGSLRGPLGTNYLVQLPEIKFTWINQTTGAGQLFNQSMNLRSIPRDFFYPWVDGKKSTSILDVFGTQYGMYQAFSECGNLRTLPELPKTMGASNVYYGYREAFQYCTSLDKIEGLTVANNTSFSDNKFNGAFYGCYRISEMTFNVQDDGTPYKCNWSNQVIDLSEAGYGFSESYCNEYNGLSKEGELKSSLNRAELLTNMPDDWWTNDYHYARYNLNSAIRTINSLPDCSSGSGNVIKFKVGQGQYGNITGDTKINNLTEEQIAVATAKGWTVSM